MNDKNSINQRLFKRKSFLNIEKKEFNNEKSSRSISFIKEQQILSDSMAPIIRLNKNTENFEKEKNNIFDKYKSLLKKNFKNNLNEPEEKNDFFNFFEKNRKNQNNYIENAYINQYCNLPLQNKTKVSENDNKRLVFQNLFSNKKDNNKIEERLDCLKNKFGNFLEKNKNKNYTENNFSIDYEENKTNKLSLIIKSDNNNYDDETLTNLFHKLKSNVFNKEEKINKNKKYLENIDNFNIFTNKIQTFLKQNKFNFLKISFLQIKNYFIAKKYSNLEILKFFIFIINKAFIKKKSFCFKKIRLNSLNFFKKNKFKKNCKFIINSIQNILKIRLVFPFQTLKNCFKFKKILYLHLLKDFMKKIELKLKKNHKFFKIDFLKRLKNIDDEILTIKKNPKNLKKTVKNIMIDIKINSQKNKIKEIFFKKWKQLIKKIIKRKKFSNFLFKLVLKKKNILSFSLKLLKNYPKRIINNNNSLKQSTEYTITFLQEQELNNLDSDFSPCFYNKIQENKNNNISMQKKYNKNNYFFDNKDFSHKANTFREHDLCNISFSNKENQFYSPLKINENYLEKKKKIKNIKNQKNKYNYSLKSFSNLSVYENIINKSSQKENKNKKDNENVTKFLYKFEENLKNLEEGLKKKITERFLQEKSLNGLNVLYNQENQFINNKSFNT